MSARETKTATFNHKQVPETSDLGFLLGMTGVSLEDLADILAVHALESDEALQGSASDEQLGVFLDQFRLSLERVVLTASSKNNDASQSYAHQCALTLHIMEYLKAFHSSRITIRALCYLQALTLDHYGHQPGEFNVEHKQMVMASAEPSVCACILAANDLWSILLTGLTRDVTMTSLIPFWEEQPKTVPVFLKSDTLPHSSSPQCAPRKRSLYITIN